MWRHLHLPTRKENKYEAEKEKKTMLRRINLDTETYYKILKDYKSFVQYDDITKFLAEGYSSKNVILVDKNTSTLICQGFVVNMATGEKTVVNEWMQYVCGVDASLDKVNTEVPWATQANKKINTILKRYYTEEEIDAIRRNHSTEEWFVPIHMLMPMKYHDGMIHKFNNCSYYDINGAHTDALCTMFPKAARALKKLHHNGGKSYINIHVGDLCNQGYRGTYNWIVKRTKEALTKIIKAAGGEIIYANTDGVIIHNAEWELETCNDIGGFKSESSDGIVYAYFCNRDDDTTPYTVYQYNHPTKGMQIKGNARLALRKGMDLSKGIVNKGKLVKDPETEAKYFINLRTEEIKIYEEN